MHLYRYSNHNCKTVTISLGLLSLDVTMKWQRAKGLAFICPALLSANGTWHINIKHRPCGRLSDSATNTPQLPSFFITELSQPDQSFRIKTMVFIAWGFTTSVTPSPEPQAMNFKGYPAEDPPTLGTEAWILSSASNGTQSKLNQLCTNSSKNEKYQQNPRII